LLADTSLFNLDSSENLMAALWASGNMSLPSTPPQDPLMASSGKVNVNHSALHQKRHDSMESQLPALSTHLRRMFDLFADNIALDRDEKLYKTGRDTITSVGKDINSEAGVFISRMKEIITSEVVRQLSHHQNIKTLKTHTLPQENTKKLKSHTLPPHQKRDQTNNLQYHPISKTTTLPINLHNSNFTTERNQTRLSSQSSSKPPPPRVQQSLTDVLADNIADLMMNGTSATNPLAALIRDNKPVIASTVRATVNSFLNEQINQVRKGFGLPAWVAIYQTKWCWGEYDRRNKKEVTNCGDSSALEDINLSPGLQRTMALMGVDKKMPERIELPNGMLRTIDGLEQFTHAVYAAEITLVVLTGIVWISSLANVFTPEKATQWTDFFMLGLCATSGFLMMIITAPYIVFEYFNGLALPGVMSLFSIRYDHGWRFVTLHIAAELLTIIGTGFWIVLERRGYRDKIWKLLDQESESSKRETNIRVFLDDKF
jgi:hypothetical protein